MNPDFPNREDVPNTERETLPTLETVDYAIWNWVQGLNLFATTSEEDGGFRKVPIIWVGSDRAFQVKSFRDVRDISGSINPPLISLMCESTSKDPSKKGQHWANVPAVNDFMGGVFYVKREIKQKKTSEFRNNEANQRYNKMNYKFDSDEELDAGPVYEHFAVPIPVYIENTYKIRVWTLYILQRNELVQPFITQVPAGNIHRFMVEHDGHRFEAFMEPQIGYSGNVDSLEKEERRFEAEITVKVLGYISGSGTNQLTPFFVGREGFSKVVITEEYEL
jgi:hypothetical protein